MRTLFFAAVTALVISSGAQAQDIDFDEASDTAPFVVDRYAPPIFQSGVAGGGRTGVLAIGTDTNSGSNDRPGGFNSAFYNTQGMKLNVDPGMNQASIELYVPDANWAAGSDDRFAGFWGFTDGGAYPIIELARVGGVDQFRGWDSAGFWTAIAAPVNYNTWATLEFTLLTDIDKIQYTVNGGPATLVNGYGSTSISQLFTQVHNTVPDGINRTAFMDNLNTGAVPEPGTWALMILGFGGAGAMLRNRRSKVALA